MDLADATWTDAADVAVDVVLVPTGSTEQHGPHAPLATDALLARAVAEAGAERFDGAAAIAPTLPYGISAEHRSFPGTLWLTPATFRRCVREVIASLGHHGWRRVVLVNGHGGNAEALDEVAAAATRDGTAYVVAFTWFDAVDAPELGHAGAVETAMLRYHHPELVREDRIEAARDGAADRWGEWVGGVNLAHDVDEFAENGVVGDPSAGDAARGRELTDEAGRALAELLGAVVSRDPGT